MKIYLCIINHRHGTNSFVAKTSRELKRKLYDYVFEWWSERFDKKIPRSMSKAIELYFDGHPTEYYETSQTNA